MSENSLCDSCGYRWLIGINVGCDKARYSRPALPYPPGQSCLCHTTERSLCETCDHLDMWWPEGVQHCYLGDEVGNMLDPGEPCRLYTEEM